jgi:hypothetical protein
VKETRLTEFAYGGVPAKHLFDHLQEISVDSLGYRIEISRT